MALPIQLGESVCVCDDIDCPIVVRVATTRVQACQSKPFLVIYCYSI